jgi:hypothetical protein
VASFLPLCSRRAAYICAAKSFLLGRFSNAIQRGPNLVSGLRFSGDRSERMFFFPAICSIFKFPVPFNLISAQKSTDHAMNRGQGIGLSTQVNPCIKQFLPEHDRSKGVGEMHAEQMANVVGESRGYRLFCLLYKDSTFIFGKEVGISNNELSQHRHLLLGFLSFLAPIHKLLKGVRDLLSVMIKRVHVHES